MTSYSDTLKAYLADKRQADFADAIGTTQASVNRYVNKVRFPEADIARRIDEATGGEVSFAIWQAEFLQRAGIEGRAA